MVSTTVYAQCNHILRAIAQLFVMMIGDVEYIDVFKFITFASAEVYKIQFKAYNQRMHTTCTSLQYNSQLKMNLIIRW